ncbi:hypothetical protein [Aeromonas phage 59.1]|nr:hypothetical protein [Aeromonas phage 59.1]
MSKWFAFSPAVGMSFHDSPEAAKRWAQIEIDDRREAAIDDDDGWDEEMVDCICWGQVAEQAKEVGNCTTGFDYELEVV